LDFSQPTPWHFLLYRLVMVVRTNVLEYIIALFVAKNKVRLKKCLIKFQIWQSSIVQVNIYITSLRLIPKFWPVFNNQCLQVSELIWPQYVHYQCYSRRWNHNWSVWDIFFKWLKLCYGDEKMNYEKIQFECEIIDVVRSFYI
jgi:hypothetical protein